MATSTATRVAADEAADQGRALAAETRQEARVVAERAAASRQVLAREASEDAGQLARTVREHAREVTGELTDQGASLIDETRAQLEAQARTAFERVAYGFREAGEQIQALAEGRPEEAPELTEYSFRASDALYGAADHLHVLAGQVETEGFSGLLSDLQGFARRRPGTFLLGAVAVGFGVGRVVRAEKADAEPPPQAPPARTVTTNGSSRRRAALPTTTGSRR